MSVAGDPFEVALRQLERRARTVFEVRRHLQRRGFSTSAIAGVVSRLSRLGYLDDRAYAARYAAYVVEEKPMGRRRAAQDLMRRGVTREIVEEALDEVFAPEKEAGALAKALEKAIRTVPVPPDEKTRRRVASYLLRRGFRPAQVMSAVDAWAEGTGERRESGRGAREEHEE